MTLDRAVAMIAAHLGVVDEEQINNMSFVFFDDVLMELGYKLTYEAISNYAGNAFCQKKLGNDRKEQSLSYRQSPRRHCHEFAGGLPD